MTIGGLLLVPVMDPPAVLSLLVALSPELLTSLAWSSFAAVCINFSTTLVLGVTSALTLVLLGQLKSCGALLAGALLFDAAQREGHRRRCNCNQLHLSVHSAQVARSASRRHSCRFGASARTALVAVEHVLYRRVVQ